MPISVALWGALLAGACTTDDAPAAMSDAATDRGSADANIDVECDARTESTCASDDRCHPLRGSPEEKFCNREPADPTVGIWSTYAGCTPAGRLSNTAITWATDPKTGRTLVFGSTEVPWGWTKLVGYRCDLLDAGAD